MPHEPHEPAPASQVAMRAVWRGRTIAEIDCTREVGGYRYFPRDAVLMERSSPLPIEAVGMSR